MLLINPTKLHLINKIFLEWFSWMLWRYAVSYPKVKDHMLHPWKKLLDKIWKKNSKKFRKTYLHKWQLRKVDFLLFFVVLGYYHFGFGTRELAGRREKRLERSWKGNTGRSASKGIPQAANTVSPVFQVALLYHDAMFFSVSMIVAMVTTCATRKGENVSRFIQNI